MAEHLLGRVPYRIGVALSANTLPDELEKRYDRERDSAHSGRPLGKRPDSGQAS